MNKSRFPLQVSTLCLFLVSAFPADALDPALDPSVGVASDGKTYSLEAVKKADSQGVQEGDSGTGEQVVTSESQAETAVLLAKKPISGEVGIESIIGQDDRQRVRNTTTYPERTMVLVVLPGGRCSGTLIGQNLVVTAGHCVHSGGSGGSWQTSATIYPGRNGASSPYGACGAQKFYSVVGWVRDKNPLYDFGAIKLNCNIGLRTGWLGFFWQSASLIGKPARISGYPGDKPLEQWTHTDQVRADSPFQTFYYTDTMPGNSGSGVFAESNHPCSTPCVHSVHTTGTPVRNAGTRITQPLFENLLRWTAE